MCRVMSDGNSVVIIMTYDSAFLLHAPPGIITGTFHIRYAFNDVTLKKLEKEMYS